MGGKFSAILLHPDSEEKVAKAFRDFDSDSNGVLDKLEWLKVSQLIWKEHDKFGVNLGDFHDASTIEYFSMEIFKKVRCCDLCPSFVFTLRSM
jgi:Ca2+-binding EF-hand superfamily protein